MNYLLVSSDSGVLTILVLLDLSAAFDTMCHSILTERLETWLGISGHSQFVVLSNVKQVCHSVLQGSVLGPIHFSIYMFPLGQII